MVTRFCSTRHLNRKLDCKVFACVAEHFKANRRNWNAWQLKNKLVITKWNGVFSTTTIIIIHFGLLQYNPWIAADANFFPVYSYHLKQMVKHFRLFYDQFSDGLKRDDSILNICTLKNQVYQNQVNKSQHKILEVDERKRWRWTCNC